MICSVKLAWKTEILSSEEGVLVDMIASFCVCQKNI